MLVHRFVRGEKLSNMWLTCPVDENNLANVRLILDTKEVPEMSSFSNVPTPQDGAAAD